MSHHEQKVEWAIHRVEYLLDVIILRKTARILKLLQMLSDHRAPRFDPVGEKCLLYIRIVLRRCNAR